MSTSAALETLRFRSVWVITDTELRKLALVGFNALLVLAVVLMSCGTGQEDVGTLGFPRSDIVVEMLPGRDANPEQVAYLRSGNRPGKYVEGSAEVVAVANMADGEVALLQFLSEPPFGSGITERVSCVAVMLDDGLPKAPNCEGVGDGLGPHEIRSVTFDDSGSQHQVVVRHTPGATAVRVETADGVAIVIRPVSGFALAEWEGGLPSKITVVWPDGETAEWADR